MTINIIIIVATILFFNLCFFYLFNNHQSLSKEEDVMIDRTQSYENMTNSSPSPSLTERMSLLENEMDTKIAETVKDNISFMEAFRAAMAQTDDKSVKNMDPLSSLLENTSELQSKLPQLLVNMRFTINEASKMS